MNRLHRILAILALAAWATSLAQADPDPLSGLNSIVAPKAISVSSTVEEEIYSVLRADLGWSGQSEAIGPFSIVKYSVPSLPENSNWLTLVEVYAPKDNMTAEIRIYSDFDGNDVVGKPLAIRIEQLRVKGAHSVRLMPPVALTPGKSVAIWVKMSDLEESRLIPIARPLPTLTISNTYPTLDNFNSQKIIEGEFQDVVVKDMPPFKAISGGQQANFLSEGIYLAGRKGSGQGVTEVIDAMNPASAGQFLKSEHLTAGEEYKSIMPFGNFFGRPRFYAVVPSRPEDFSYAVPNYALTLLATKQHTTFTLNTRFYDSYNPVSPRLMTLPAPAYDKWSDHPDLPSGYDSQKRMIMNDVALSSDGNRVYVIANRYQDRKNTTNTYRYWWELGVMTWDFTDPYNPRFISDKVYSRSEMHDSGLVTEHKFYYWDIDATQKFTFVQPNSIYGFGYRLNVEISDDLEATDLWDQLPTLGPNGLIYSIENSLGYNPRTNSHRECPLGPGNIMYADLSANPDQPSAIDAGTELPFPAKDYVIKGNWMYVADAQAGVVLVNIADPKNPQVLGGYIWPGANAVAIDALQRGDLTYTYIATIEEEGQKTTGPGSSLVYLSFDPEGNLVGFDPHINSYASSTGAPSSWWNVYEMEGFAIPIRALIGIRRYASATGWEAYQ